MLKHFGGASLERAEEQLALATVAGFGPAILSWTKIAGVLRDDPRPPRSIRDGRIVVDDG